MKFIYKTIFLGKLVFQFNKFENNLKKAVFDKFICYKKMMDEKEKSKLKTVANEIANVDLESAYSYNELFDNVSHNKLLEISINIIIVGMLILILE